MTGIAIIHRRAIPGHRLLVPATPDPDTICKMRQPTAAAAAAPAWHATRSPRSTQTPAGVAASKCTDEQDCRKCSSQSKVSPAYHPPAKGFFHHQIIFTPSTASAPLMRLLIMNLHRFWAYGLGPLPRLLSGGTSSSSDAVSLARGRGDSIWRAAHTLLEAVTLCTCSRQWPGFGEVCESDADRGHGGHRAVRRGFGG